MLAAGKKEKRLLVTFICAMMFKPSSPSIENKDILKTNLNLRYA